MADILPVCVYGYFEATQIHEICACDLWVTECSTQWHKQKQPTQTRTVLLLEKNHRNTYPRVQHLVKLYTASKEGCTFLNCFCCYYYRYERRGRDAVSSKYVSV